MKSQLVRADFCSTGTGLPKLAQRLRTASLGRQMPLAHSSHFHTHPSPGDSWSPPPPRPEAPRSGSPYPGARPRPVGAALGTHSLGPAASPAPQPGASAALPSLIKEGGSGALNLCLPLQGGCNSTTPPLRPRHPPRLPARTLTHTHTHFFKKLQLGCQVGCLGDFGKVPGRGCVPIFP